MRIAFIDTYYPEVFDQIPPAFSYHEHMEKVNALHFGTSHFYSDAFKAYGWQAIDIVGNDTRGQALWSFENGGYAEGQINSAVRQLESYRPDVIYCHDLSFFPITLLDSLKQRTGAKVLTGQISCPWPGDGVIKCYDMLFTSFPHYLDRFAALGVGGKFLQIGFGRSVLPLLCETRRDIDIVFVGGLGGGATKGHWARGTDVLAAVAACFPTFQWHGYGYEEAPSVLKRCFRGPAWGLEMYNIYKRSKIVVNRHGEVAQGYANNMRMFEATGCGALLMTEDAKNITDYFDPATECGVYMNSSELIEGINFYLDHENLRALTAEHGQIRTLTHHTYDDILKTAKKDIMEFMS